MSRYLTKIVSSRVISDEDMRRWDQLLPVFFHNRMKIDLMDFRVL